MRGKREYVKHLTIHRKAGRNRYNNNNKITVEFGKSFTLYLTLSYALEHWDWFGWKYTLQDRYRTRILRSLT